MKQPKQFYIIFGAITLALGTLTWSEKSIAQTLLQQQGRLEAGDEILSSDGSLYDSYTFEGQAGQQITITLESNEFDTYLILLDPKGNKLAENDGLNQSNTSSVLTVTLPSDGTYTVIANSYDRNSLGRYALVVQSNNSLTATQNQSLNQLQSSSQGCESAISNAVQKIEEGRNVEVVRVSDTDIAEYYTGYPANRTIRYMFGMNGSAATSVMASPQFMASISTGVIAHCETVGMVEFNIYRTDYTIAFGLFGSGQIEKFRCVDPRARTRYQWGEITCL